MPAEPRLVPAAETSAVAMLPGVVRRTFAWGERTLLAEVSLTRGSLIPLHSHPHEQIGYVARGRLEFTLATASGELRRTLAAGDGYVIPGDTPHAVLALEDSVAVDVFSPVREEYKG